MKLVDLEPNWVNAGGDEVKRKLPDGALVDAPRREGVGVTFKCPCGACDDMVYIPFSNPLDGGEAYDAERVSWLREGETFEDLTLSPSIQRIGGCEWHGFVKNGEIV